MHSTPTSSRDSSTMEARSWSVASSMPRKRACADFEGGMEFLVKRCWPVYSHPSLLHLPTLAMQM